MTDIWQAALYGLREKVSSQTFEKWFEPIGFHHRDEYTTYLEVADEFRKAWIEENYLDLIEDALEAVCGAKMSVEIEVHGSFDEPADEATDDVHAIDAPDEPVAARSSRLDAPQVGSPNSWAESASAASLATSVRDQGSTREEAPPAPAREAGGAASEAGSVSSPGGTIEPPADLEQQAIEAGLNPRYVFPEFVVGSANQFAHAACMAVANEPAKSYNPLFIFGGVGLGKTHLLHAVGIDALQRRPGTRVVNLSAEDFMNKLIRSIGDQDMNSFRTQFRNNCDVLLIDDIQFIAGGERTQEEFFHTFNALYQSGKQIVITSDKSPQEIPGIEERLRSRFSWGLIADIQPPEIETRIAILEKKARADNIELDKEVAVFLASSIRSNVRELEGTLIRLGAQASLMNQPITMELARDMLKRMNIEQGREVDTEQIIQKVARHFEITAKDIKGKRRPRAISRPRQYAMYLARKHTGESYPELGRKFGGKDHTTVLAACQKYEKLLEEGDEDAVEIIDELEDIIFR